MKGFHNKKPLLFTLLATMLILLLFAPVAEAKGTATTNSPPVITTENTLLTVNQDSSGNISLQATDSNRDSLTWSVTIQPENGTATISNVINRKGSSSATVTYTPTTGYNGTDTLTVRVKDRTAYDEILISIIVTAKVTTINYVSLGDSIATGTVYPGNTITSYVTYFAQYLQAQNPTATISTTRFATDGDRTNELYNKLGLDGSSGDINLMAAVRGAKIITLSIGGNNLMQAAKDDSFLGGYNFNSINTAVADQGLADFQDQWILIIQKLKGLNSSAQLIVNTTYNPYNETDTSLHKTVDSYLSRLDGSGLNDLILGKASLLGYSVANVFQNFDANYRNNMGDVTYFYPTDLLGQLTRNPHPNSTGQNIIARLCEQVFIK